MQYIHIDKEALPYRFEMELEGELFVFEVHYNARFDFFTIDIEKNGEIILQGSKIVYGNPVFNYSNDTRLPKVEITPLDESGSETRVGYDQLGESVFLFVGVIE